MTASGLAEAPLVRLSIVGAGPGDPELLTVKALRRLELADVVFHDGLVPAAIVGLAERARHVPVSRRPGSSRVAPSAVASLMIDAARQGLRVVRLRAGDPFVFARGAEEMLALADAGVPFEIVPGLTTASAAPTVAGIPLTHRGTASAFVVVSGHDEASYVSVLHGLPRRGVTVVVLMGLAQAGAIARRLLEWQWLPETPMAIVVDASQPAQQIWKATLEQLASAAPALPADAAGVIVIGDVVTLSDRLGAEGMNAHRERRDRHRPHREQAGAGGRNYGLDQRSDDIRPGATVLCR